MKSLTTMVLTASLAFGSLFAVSESASAAPVAQIEIAHSSDVVPVRDERDWRRHHDRRDWRRHDRRDWHHGRGDWRRDRWHGDRGRDWRPRHRRDGVVIRF